jgi:hypothetical protein
MKYDLLLENWNKFLNEEDATSTTTTSTAPDAKQAEDEKKKVEAQKALIDLKTAIQNIQNQANILQASLSEAKKKKKGKDDRCTRIAKSKYDVWPSAYASGAVVRCRRGEIWKGISEDATDEQIKYQLLLEELSLIEEKDPKTGSGKKPEGSGRRLYTDENPKDTVSVKFSTVQDIKDTLSKESFKSKSHARQSQIINLIHQRVRVAYERAKEPDVKARLKKALDYAEERKEASKKKTQSLQKEQQETLLNERCWKGYTQKGMKTMFGKKYPNCVKKTNEEIEDQELQTIEEKWSDKYKRSIDCKNPKGFSQKAHCQGRKKNEEIVFDDIELLEEEIIDEAKKKKPYKPNFSREKKQGLHGWFARNKGKGWINCRTGGPCGRSSADKKGGKYPACRPTKAQCKAAGRGPLRKKKSSKPISWVKKKKKD